MSNTPTSGTSHPASSIQRLTSRISHLATHTIIQLLTTAIKFRKAGLISLFAFFLINCYFMLFDQQNYVLFLENFSPDKDIHNINFVFFQVQLPITICIILLALLDKESIDSIKNKQLKSKINWNINSTAYIVACFVWLVISYIPFLLFDEKTMINLCREDGFYQNAGAFWLFISFALFLWMFAQKGRNIWFLALSLLFLFGAGEEISWGQRIFHFKTPDIMSSNIQSEFNIHNLPIFDGRSTLTTFDDNGLAIVHLKKGFLEIQTSSGVLLLYFCLLSFIVIPLLATINSKIKNTFVKLHLPIAPLFIIPFYIVETIISKEISGHYTILSYSYQASMAEEINIARSTAWSAGELHEAYISFLFMIIGLWLSHRMKKTHSNQKTTSPLHSQ